MDKLTGIISSAELMGGQIVGMRGLKGDKGDTGNGIASIAKTGTSGDIDTYTITFTDGDTTTFNVTNGHTPVITQVPVATDLWTGTAIYVDGVYLTTIMDGAKGDKGDTGATGATGNGIASITLTDTTGSVKTYTITFTNGDTTTFQVTDGEVTNAILEKVLPTDTKSGSIASFPDGTDLFPALSCVADINPIQDLHGYDKPWVGGGGKNLYGGADGTYSIGSTRSMIVSDGITQYKVNISASSTTVIPEATLTSYLQNKTLQSGTYTFSATSNALTSTEVLKFTLNLSDGTTATNGSSFTLTASADIVSITTPDAESYTVGTYTMQIQIEKGSTATAWTPWENICPISGWNSVGVVDVGSNLWDEVWEEGYIAPSTGQNSPATGRIRSKNYIPVKSGTTYYFKCGSGKKLGLFAYDADKAYIGCWSGGVWRVSSGTTDDGNASITVPDNCEYIRFICIGSYGATYLNDISINYPSTDHDYHAYNGTTYTVSWSGDAGTVYGGTVDVVSGVLTVTHVSITLTDFSAWAYQTTNHYKALLKRADQIGVPMPNTSSEARSAVICSAFNTELDGRDKPYGTLSLYASNDGTFYFWNNDDVAADKNDMISRLEAIQPQIVYELATPTTYTLTAQQVDLLLGQNTVFADTGDVEVEYKADIQRYIAKKLAE